MGGGCDSPRSWERDECSTCRNHICPELTSYTSYLLEKALKEVRKREQESEQVRLESARRMKENRILELKAELKRLENE